MVWAMMFSTKSTHLEKAKAAKVGHQTNSKRCFHKRRLSLPTMAYLFSATLAIYVFCLFLLKAWSSVTPCFVCSLSCFRKRRMHPSSLPKERTAPTSTKKPKSSLRKHLPTFEPWKKLLLFIESWLFNKDPYNGLWNNRHITGLSTFDLSARETSHTTGQHLHDSRALKRNKTRETTWRSHEKKWSKKLLCTLPRPLIRTRSELPPTRIALAFVSPIKSWEWSQGCWCRLTSTLRSVKVTPHRLICCFAMHQCRTSLQAYWL